MVVKATEYGWFQEHKTLKQKSVNIKAVGTKINIYYVESIQLYLITVLKC